MSNFDCLSCEHGDKCTAYMAIGITRCNEYKKKKPEIKDSGERTVFPTGSVRDMHEGKGENWWCVLYPTLCFTDETTASFSEDAEKKLQKSLSEADFSALNEGVTFQLKIAEVFEDLYYTFFSD